jgi:branched-chain amino acid transport system permease protein
MHFLLLLLSTGLVTGATYGLIGMGFALIYKATGVVNFAQGELVMLTAYIAFNLSGLLGLSFFPLMLVAVPIAMALGLALERIFIRPMIGEPVFSIVMVTVGLAVTLRGIVVLAWGSEPITFAAGISTHVVKIGGIPFYLAQLYLIAALGIVTLLAHLFLRHSRYGIAMRAVASNETAALLAGVGVSQIHALAWMLSSAIAAIAGILFAINFKLAPDLWFQGLQSFPAVILGGMDSVIGASLGGIVIGIIESLAQGYLGEGLRDIAGFVVIIAVLMIRPFGLFGSKDIERV